MINFKCQNDRTDFIITTSVDGHLKFWKKTAVGVEFVKHYKAHLGIWISNCFNSSSLSFVVVVLVPFAYTIYGTIFTVILGPIVDVSASADGLLVCTVGADMAVKVFDVINFGMFLCLFYL